MENIVNVVKQIASVVLVKLTDASILGYTRVSPINKKEQIPRAIVVKLPSTRCRDEVYFVVQICNKVHQEES